MTRQEFDLIKEVINERNAFKNRISGHLRVVDEWKNEILECINQVEEFEPLLNLIKRGVKHE